MHTPPSTKKDVQGFTLIELLVVITIVAIIAGILLPVYGSVMNSSRKTQVINDERNLIVAVLNYKAEYSKFPANADQISGTQATGYDTVYGDPGTATLYPNYELIDVLRAQSDAKYNYNNAMNPSKTVYFDAPYVKNNNDPRHGIVRVNHNDGNYILKPGTLVDPWGGEYVVWLDLSQDGNLTKATQWFYDIPDTQIVHGTVQVGSLGPDGDFGSKEHPGHLEGSDDILTTQ